MLFKEEKFKNEFWQLDSKARYLACKVDYLLWIKFGKELIITMIFYEGGSGIHSKKCKRAFDGSKHNLTENEVKWIENHINENFPYDSTRPNMKTCLPHKVDEKDIGKYEIPGFKPADHLHFQVWVK